MDQSNPVAALNELLLGLANNSGRSFGVTNRRIFQKSLGLYVQDSWKVKPNFTVELGVRWDVAGALGETKNQGANFLPDDPKADADGFVNLATRPLYNTQKTNFGPRAGFAWDCIREGQDGAARWVFFKLRPPQLWHHPCPPDQCHDVGWNPCRFLTQIPEGIFATSIITTPADNQAIFEWRKRAELPVRGFHLHGSRREHLRTERHPSPPFNVVQVIRDFATPMNHAYNLTVEQQVTNKTSFSLAYVGTLGERLVNWRDLNACPISATEACDTSRQPFGTRFPQYNHILQLNNDAYSNYNSLQAAYKVRDLHGLSGQLNFVWSRSFDTGSANRGGSYLSDFQNPYNVDKGYAPADFDTPSERKFHGRISDPQVPRSAQSGGRRMAN